MVKRGPKVKVEQIDGHSLAAVGSVQAGEAAGYAKAFEELGRDLRAAALKEEAEGVSAGEVAVANIEGKPQLNVAMIGNWSDGGSARNGATG